MGPVADPPNCHVASSAPANLDGRGLDENLLNDFDISAFIDAGPADILQGTHLHEAEVGIQDSVPPSVPVDSPVVEQGIFSYPTPSTTCYLSPRIETRETAHISSATNAQKRTGREDHTRRRKRKRTARASPAIGSYPIVHTLLKSCIFRKGKKSEKDGSEENYNTEILSDARIERVLLAGAHLVGNDLCGSLRPHLESWKKNQSQNLHALGIPAQWQGIEAAGEYFIKIDSEYIADPIGVRVAQLLLFINYTEMCKRPEDFCSQPRKNGEQKKTLVLRCIIESIPGYFSEQQNPTVRRDLVNNQIRHGRWWWKLSRWLGLGVLLLCSEDLFRKMYVRALSDCVLC